MKMHKNRLGIGKKNPKYIFWVSICVIWVKGPDTILAWSVLKEWNCVALIYQLEAKAGIY